MVLSCYKITGTSLNVVLLLAPLVPVKLHYLLGLVPAVSVLSVLLQGGGPGAFFLVLISSGLLLYLTVLVHEIGFLSHP